MTADLWDTIPGLTPTTALCLLAVEHAEETGLTYQAVGGRPPLVEVSTVAAVTGLSTATAGAALRQLAKKGHLVQVSYIGMDKSGADCLRKGYRLPGGEG